MLTCRELTCMLNQLRKLAPGFSRTTAQDAIIVTDPIGAINCICLTELNAVKKDVPVQILKGFCMDSMSSY